MRQFRSLASAIAALGMLAVLAACGSRTGPTRAADPAADGALDGSWFLTAGTLDDVPLDTAAGQVTLDIAGGSWSGRSACNSYSSDVTAAGDRIAVGPAVQTEMGCEEPVMTLETDYLTALQRVTAATRTGDTLRLTGDSVSLEYSPVPAVRPADLVGTVWTLSTLLEGDTASSVVARPATLTLQPNGDLVGSTGCRDFRGRWEQEADQIGGDQLVIGPLATTRIACKGAAAPQDRHVLAALTGRVSATVDGRSLTIQNGALGLGYDAG